MSDIIIDGVPLAGRLRALASDLETNGAVESVAFGLRLIVNKMADQMTFEDYIKAVIAYYMMGGTTWEVSYWRMLQEHRPDLVPLAVEKRLLLTAPYVQLGDFIYFVFTNWAKP